MPAKKKKTKAKDGTKSSKKSPTFTPELSGEAFLVFLHRVIQWLEINLPRVTDLCRKFDSNGDNHVTTDDFIVAMRILEAPITRSETGHLIKIVDQNGAVNILEFDKQIRDYHDSLLRATSPEPGDESDERSTTISHLSPSRVSTKCPSCQIGIAEPPTDRNPRFIRLKVVLAPFKATPSHPGHFVVEVTDSTTVHGLKDIIQAHLEGAIESVALFREPTCSKSSYLAPSWSLEHCGLVGGPKTEPTTAEVFYDYMPLVMDCPILMTDSHIRDLPLESSKVKGSKDTKQFNVASRIPES